MKRAGLKRIVATLAALSLSSAAFAQYIWLDERGVKQYSDMPPPSSVPSNRILKQPGAAGQSAARATEPAENAAGAFAAPSREKAPMTTAEKNADFQKRRAEQAEKEKKAAEQQRLAAEKTKNCERAAGFQRALESGERIARTANNGERAYLTDQERAREMNENKHFLQDCK